MTTTDPKLIEPVAWLREWRTIIGTTERDVGLWKPSGDSPVKVTPLYTAAAINEAAQKERAGIVEAMAELQLAAFLAGRGSTRADGTAPSMDDFRRMAATAIERGEWKEQG